MSDATQTDTETTPAPKHPGYAWVKSGLTGADRDKVALSEWDPAHPENAEGRTEVFVAGADSPPVRVAKTPEVVRHLREGELVEVGESDAKAHHDRHQAEMRAREKRQLENQPQFSALAAALSARGLPSIHELITGEPTTQPLPDADRAELETLRAKQAADAQAAMDAQAKIDADKAAADAAAKADADKAAKK